MKPCFECKESKPFSEFYSHPQSADKLLHVCKACHRHRMKVRALTNPRVQEYDRARAKMPERKLYNQANAARWRKNNPDGYRAQTALNNAVRDGRIRKEPCALCGGSEHVHAHHKDYAEPLVVVWLCAKCHHRLHATFPELGANCV